jgi:hypothetical protein
MLFNKGWKKTFLFLSVCFFLQIAKAEENNGHNQIIIEVLGTGLSKRQAKTNAYKNIITQIYNNKILTKLKFDEMPFAEDALFLTKVVRKILFQNIEYVALPEETNLYRGSAWLTNKKLNILYDVVQPRISVDLSEMSASERKIATLESAQIAILLDVARQVDPLQYKKKFNYALDRVYYYTQKENTGLAIFPEEIFKKATVKINDKEITSNEVFLPQGKHSFKVTAHKYFPVNGYFYMEGDGVKKISVPIVRKPEKRLAVALKVNFSNQLLQYTKHILNSYGWDIDNKANFILEGSLFHKNEDLSNNLIKRKVKISFAMGEKVVDKSKKTISSKPFTEIHQQVYDTEFIYSGNDLATLARQQRLAIINSLLTFLAKFDDHDYRFVYFSQEESN